MRKLILALLCLFPLFCSAQIFAPLTLKTKKCKISESELTWTFTHSAIFIEDEKNGVVVIEVTESLKCLDDEIAIISCYETPTATYRIMYDKFDESFFAIYTSINEDEYYPVLN